MTGSRSRLCGNPRRAARVRSLPPLISSFEPCPITANYLSKHLDLRETPSKVHLSLAMSQRFETRSLPHANGMWHRSQRKQSRARSVHITNKIELKAPDRPLVIYVLNLTNKRSSPTCS